MKKIIIRTKGGTGIGYGHFFRCLSLAKAIRSISPETEVTFLINLELANLLDEDRFNYIVRENFEKDAEVISEIKPDLFILDSYLADDSYLKEIKKHTKLMLIDDNNDIYDSSIPDIIYNGNLHAENLGYKQANGQIRFLGPQYLIMKEEYWTETENEDEDVDKDGILITTGGTDDYGIALEFLKALQKLERQHKIELVIGPGYKEDYIQRIKDNIKREDVALLYKPNSLKNHILQAKIVITAGGSTVYEVLSQGSVPILFSIADNQDLICEELRREGLAYLGKYPHIEYEALSGFIDKKYDDQAVLDKEIFSRIDGKGVSRLAKILLSKV